ncbi:MAG TPA: ribosomal protein S18-alanine N-acetyltransferase [Vicinamibacteria bacterium]
MNPWLRRAGPDDAAAVAALERAASLHPWSEALLRDELARPAPDAVLVLEGREGILAYCAARVVLDELQVMNLAVDARARRRGFGRFLLRSCLALGERAGVRRALLEVRAGNGAARALYADCGFVLLGRRKAYYTEPIEDALVLVRDAPAVRP